MTQVIHQPAREIRVVDRSDVVVVGGGPVGISAAVSAARNRATVTLLERYTYVVGGLAAGGMVLVLDDMINGSAICRAGRSDRIPMG